MSLTLGSVIQLEPAFFAKVLIFTIPLENNHCLYFNARTVVKDVHMLDFPIKNRELINLVQERLEQYYDENIAELLLDPNPLVREVVEEYLTEKKQNISLKGSNL